MEKEEVEEGEVVYVTPEIADAVTKIVEGSLQSICAAHRRLALDALKGSISTIAKGR